MKFRYYMFPFRHHFNRFVAYITVKTHLILFKMDDFINVIKKDPQVCIKINKMLDRYRFCIYTYNCTYIIV